MESKGIQNFREPNQTLSKNVEMKQGTIVSSK